MAIEWGAFEGGMRVGMDVSWLSSSGDPFMQHTNGGVIFTVKYYTDNSQTFSDGQSLSFGGNITGSQSYTNNQSGSSGATLRETRTHTYNYGANSYGSSPGSRTFSVTASGLYTGGTPSKSVTVSIPARPVAPPLAPSNVDIQRLSDDDLRITWTRNSSAARPYDFMRLLRTRDSESNVLIASALSGTSTSFTAGATPNHKYFYSIRANNDEGSSAYVDTPTCYTTPAAPSSCVRTTNGADEDITWNKKSGYTEFNTQIWRSINGTWSLLTTVSGATEFFKDTTSSPSDKVKYRVRHYTIGGVQGTLYSAYSNETTETAGVTSPPNAPTNLAPKAGAIVVVNQAKTFTWTYNTTDASAQSAFHIQYREVGSGTWLDAPSMPVTSSAKSWAAPAGTFTANKNYEWQVKTKGADAAYSVYSAAATFATVPDPATALLSQRLVAVDLGSGELVTHPPSGYVPNGTAQMLKSVTAANIPNTTYTVVSNWSNVYNDGVFYSNHTAGLMTIDVPGVYSISVGALVTNNASGRRILVLRHNGSQAARVEGAPDPYWAGSLTKILKLAVGDTLDMAVYQSSGVTLAFDPAIAHYWDMVKLSD